MARDDFPPEMPTQEVILDDPIKKPDQVPEVKACREELESNSDKSRPEELDAQACGAEEAKLDSEPVAEALSDELASKSNADVAEFETFENHNRQFDELQKEESVEAF
jgi:hypothetical protein